MPCMVVLEFSDHSSRICYVTSPAPNNHCSNWLLPSNLSGSGWRGPQQLSPKASVVCHDSWGSISHEKLQIICRAHKLRSSDWVQSYTRPVHALSRSPQTAIYTSVWGLYVFLYLSSQPLRHNKALPFEHQPIINTKFISQAVVGGQLRWDLWPILGPSLQYGVHKQVNSENVYYWLRCRVLSSICLSSANPLLTSNCSKYVLV